MRKLHSAARRVGCACLSALLALSLMGCGGRDDTDDGGVLPVPALQNVCASGENALDAMTGLTRAQVLASWGDPNTISDEGDVYYVQTAGVDGADNCVILYYDENGMISDVNVSAMTQIDSLLDKPNGETEPYDHGRTNIDEGKQPDSELDGDDRDVKDKITAESGGDGDEGSEGEGSATGGGSEPGMLGDQVPEESVPEEPENGVSGEQSGPAESGTLDTSLSLKYGG